MRGGLLHALTDGQPVSEVVGHVVAAEGDHGHGIAAHHADLARDGRRRLRAHGRTEEDAMRPVKGFEDERDGARPP